MVHLVDANIIGICLFNVKGDIIEANEAFMSAPMRWSEMTPPEWREADARAIAELNATRTAQPFEKELFPERRQPRTHTSGHAAQNRIPSLCSKVGPNQAIKRGQFRLAKSEKKEDHTRQVSGDCGNGSHNKFSFELTTINQVSGRNARLRGGCQSPHPQ
jgi:hypothetical protein